MAGGLGDVPFRPNPLTPFPRREGGKFGGIPPFPLGREARGEINPPERWRTLSPRGWANGVQGGGAPMAGGLGDVPPE